LNKFVYVFDATLANDYKLDKSFLFMHETIIDKKQAWLFSISNKELKFKSIDKSKTIFTNKLLF